MSLSNYKPFLFLFLLSFKVVSAEDALPVPAFVNELELSSNTGHTRLLWKIEPGELSNIEDIEFELQRSQNTLFTKPVTLYNGKDQGSFISGLNNGKYYFRLRTVNDNSKSSWSETAMLTVEHHSLQFAFTLFGIGGVVFLLTTAMLIQGVKKTNKELP